MKTSRPCVMIWLAPSGTRKELLEAYQLLISRIRLTGDRSSVCLGGDPDDPPVDAQEMISSLPLSDRYIQRASEAADKQGLEKATFLVAVLFREIGEAPTSTPVPEEPLLRYIGTFEFPFPEPGDFVSRDDHEWLGITDAYVSGETG